MAYNGWHWFALITIESEVVGHRRKRSKNMRQKVYELTHWPRCVDICIPQNVHKYYVKVESVQNDLYFWPLTVPNMPKI